MNTASTLEYRPYPSSRDPALKLYANFITPDRPRPILLSMHGWHGAAKGAHADDLPPSTVRPWFIIEPDLRGRGDSTGKPDCNGWELQDAVDAVEFARKEYAGLIATPECVYLTGGSGGGSNVLGLVGKFPDYFCVAVCESGISDFALWFEHDGVGEFRDEMEGQAWIGGNPATRAEAYASRGGLTTVANLMTPLAITHGELDPRCPIEHPRQYVEKAGQAGRAHLVSYLELKGVAATGGHWGGITPAQEKQRKELVERHLATHSRPVEIPRQGQWVVAGYLKTRHVEVIFDTIDRIGDVSYDLDASRFTVGARSAEWATLRIRQRDGRWREQRVDVNR